jgi:hypothetical protein
MMVVFVLGVVIWPLPVLPTLYYCTNHYLLAVSTTSTTYIYLLYLCSYVHNKTNTVGISLLILLL